MAERRWRVGSVRLRTTAGATFVVGVALALGAFALLGILRRSLTENVETAAELRAEDVVAILESGTAPDALAVDGDEDALVQVIDPFGVVRSSTANTASAAPIAQLAPGEAVTLDRLPIDEGESYRVVAEQAQTPEGPLTVLVARSLESVDESTKTVGSILAGGIPLLLALVAATTWVVTGQALRPVEGIRREVASISEAGLSRRVPQPGGGDEVARLATTMNAMLERLEHARDRQRRFISDASHELRSPIASIRHQLEVALANPATTVVDDLAHGVLAEDLRMQGLVENLLLLARADEGRLAGTRRPVDLDDLVLAEGARLRQQGGVQVSTSRVSAARVLGDRSQLVRLVRNLAENAERHASHRVELALSVEGSVVRLCVADDGAGIPVAERNRVFERFTRLDEARTRDAGGAGLGLAIVAEVAAAHAGAVSVDDAVGGGARFLVTMPAIDAD